MHISSIGAGMYSDLSIADVALPGTITETSLNALFAQLDYDNDDAISVGNVREFPAMGTPPNVVNVPVYGQATSQQIQGQADAPSIELQLNYVASEWASGTVLGDMVGDGTQRVFRFTLLNAKPPGLASEPSGLGMEENSIYYWVGKVEALTVTPNLTDSNVATVTVTIQSDFYGAYTINEP